MKKLFLFIVLLFSLFFLNPTDIFAYTYVPEDIKITFYGSGGSTDYCEGLTQCYNFVPDKIASRVQIQSQKVSFTEGKQYKMYISLKLSVPNDYTIYDYYLSDYLVRNYAINVNKSDFKFLYWDDFGWFNAYQWDLEITVNPTFQGSGVSFDFYKSQETNQQIWILDVLDFHSELMSDSSDTNIIIDNQNKNTQDIIDNQNKNTQEEIESQQVCKIIDKANISTNGYLDSSGSVTVVDANGITDYLSIQNSDLYLLEKRQSNNYACFYNVNKVLISCVNTYNLNLGKITIPENASYFRATIRIDENKPQYKICTNGNQALDDSINDLENAIIDDSSPDLSSLENSAGWLPPGPVDSILNLPLSLFQNLTDNLSKSCQPVTLALPYVNRNIVLPCVSSLYSQIGIQSFINWVGVICSCLILYNYFLKLYKWVDDTLTFRENNWQDWGGV